jgi:hypothetical protein
MSVAFRPKYGISELIGSREIQGFDALQALYDRINGGISNLTGWTRSKQNQL